MLQEIESLGNMSGAVNDAGGQVRSPLKGLDFGISMARMDFAMERLSTWHV